MLPVLKNLAESKVVRDNAPKVGQMVVNAIVGTVITQGINKVCKTLRGEK